jgi:hypothetical protein
MSFVVIHPAGDKTVLKVVEMSRATRQALGAMVTASRCVFSDPADAESYAVDFAGHNQMTYLGSERAPRGA